MTQINTIILYSSIQFLAASVLIKLPSLSTRIKCHAHTHDASTQTSVLRTLSRITRVSQYQNQSGFTEASQSGCQWHQMGHMQMCTSPQTDNHASTPPLGFLQARCSSCHPTNSVKALKAKCPHVELSTSCTQSQYQQSTMQCVIF